MSFLSWLLVDVGAGLLGDGRSDVIEDVMTDLLLLMGGRIDEHGCGGGCDGVVMGGGGAWCGG